MGRSCLIYELDPLAQPCLPLELLKDSFFSLFGTNLGCQGFGEIRQVFNGG